jgi:hypothetical protein
LATELQTFSLLYNAVVDNTTITTDNGAEQ